MPKTYATYIITNKFNGTLYVGVTSDLKRRIYQHKGGFVDGFSKRYGLKMLVYYELCGDINEAIAREKQLKASSRLAKLKLIAKFNPKWRDLYDEI